MLLAKRQGRAVPTIEKADEPVPAPPVDREPEIDWADANAQTVAVGGVEVDGQCIDAYGTPVDCPDDWEGW